jgi:hypothetical protein
LYRVLLPIAKVVVLPTLLKACLAARDFASQALQSRSETGHNDGIP